MKKILSMLGAISLISWSALSFSHTLGTISFRALPIEAQATLTLIKLKGPFPYWQDDSVFGNFEKVLPAKPHGYYHEYTVLTPGSTDRGKRRIVAGELEYYYTGDHYHSFFLIIE